VILDNTLIAAYQPFERLFYMYWILLGQRGSNDGYRHY